MVTRSLIKSQSTVKQAGPFLHVDRLVALWALSEAALGGVLHALQIPFTGLFINSSAVLFMVLIACASDKKGAVLRATLIVMIVKGMVSPHTPLNAFIAVGFQGLLGEFLLRSKKYLLLSSLALGIITLLQSAFQKIIVLTIVFGNTLWESIDVFGNFVLNQLSFLSIEPGNYDISFWMIAVYMGIHLIAGIGIGLLAAKVPGWILLEISEEKTRYKYENPPENFTIKVNRKKKNWLKKPSSLIILSLAGILILSSYLFPEISETQGLKAVLMVVRSVFIMFLWYILVGPLLLKAYQKFLKSKQNTYTEEVQKTLQILPPLRFIIYQTWNNTRNISGYKRIRAFLTITLVNILSAEFYADKNN